MEKKNKQNKLNLYLDDIRTPFSEYGFNIIARSYDEFKSIIDENLSNIALISFDHDLGPISTDHYFSHTVNNHSIDYSMFDEKTGYDCAKYFVNKLINTDNFHIPALNVHSANPVGSANIIGYIENYFKIYKLPYKVSRIVYPHNADF